MEHALAIGRPGEAVGDLQAVHLLLRAAGEVDAVERADRLLVLPVVHAADPERAVRSDPSVIQPRSRAPLRFDLAKLLARAGGEIEEDDAVAERDDEPAGGGETDRADLALERPGRPLAGREIQPEDRLLQDVDEIEPVRPLVVERALADPASRYRRSR